MLVSVLILLGSGLIRRVSVDRRRIVESFIMVALIQY